MMLSAQPASFRLSSTGWHSFLPLSGIRPLSDVFLMCLNLFPVYLFQVAADPAQSLLSSSLSTSGSTTTLRFTRKLNNGGAVPVASTASVAAVWALGQGAALADHGPSTANRGDFVFPATSAATVPRRAPPRPCPPHQPFSPPPRPRPRPSPPRPAPTPRGDARREPPPLPMFLPHRPFRLGLLNPFISLRCKAGGT